MRRPGLVIAVAAMVLAGVVRAQDRAVSDRPRLLVLTDISSLTAGVREPDDGQSLIRLMLYANELELEGLIASSNMGHGQTVRPELIRQVIDAYARVLPNLRLHDQNYPPPERLLEGVKAGQPVAGPRVPVTESIGEGKVTEASAWIRQIVDRPDPRPLWVNVWGGAADLAQALWEARRSRSAAEVARFVGKLRVHSIGDQDSTGAWIKSEFPDLLFLTRSFGYRGMYRGGDRSLVSPEWVEEHVRNGHGPLGAVYPNYNGGDIWSGQLGAVRGVKEGDTPAFLALLPNGLGDPERLELGSWGGRFTGAGTRWTDVRDLDVSAPDDPHPLVSTVYRWRPAFQADFQARLDWCAKPFAEANHPPVIRLAGPRQRTVRSSHTLTLDASQSSDPDGQRLSFSWSCYPPPEDGAPRPTIRTATSPSARFTAPAGSEGRRYHVVVAVRDTGSPALERYGRVEIRVSDRVGQ